MKTSTTLFPLAQPRKRLPWLRRAILATALVGLIGGVTMSLATRPAQADGWRGHDHDHDWHDHDWDHHWHRGYYGPRVYYVPPPVYYVPPPPPRVYYPPPPVVYAPPPSVNFVFPFVFH